MMNHSFDYNGHVVAPSKPQKVLRKTVKRLQIDSSDRDINKYYTNGDFVIYLPRVYENVVGIRLISAEFPPLVVSSGASYAGANKHLCVNGQNIRSSRYTTDTPLNEWYYYFMIDLVGLNSLDETAVASSVSAYPDGSFAHIPIVPETLASGNYYISYNNKSGPDNEAKFSPAIGKLDRLRIRCRTHDLQGDSGFIYWTRNGAVADGNQPGNTLDSGVTSNVDVNFTLVLELEYLENGFDEFSSFETRVGHRN
jgi:hypothetical protein